MPTPVRMPKLGWTMEEGTVLQWYKKEGESVTEGQPLLEVETDKVAIDVESPASGILRAIKVGAEETVAVETVIAIIAGPHEPLQEITETPRAAGSSEPAGERAARPEASAPDWAIEPPPAKGEAVPQKRPRALASPAARRLAREQGLDLAEIKGSGPGGVASLQGCPAPYRGEVGPAGRRSCGQAHRTFPPAQDHRAAHSAEFSNGSPLHGHGRSRHDGSRTATRDSGQAAGGKDWMQTDPDGLSGQGGSQGAGCSPVFERTP